MSNYLKAKMMKGLREASTDFVPSNEDLVEKGFSSLKSKISNIEVEEQVIKTEKPKHTPRYEGTELAEVAVDVYNNNIKKEDEQTLEKRVGPRSQYGVEPYITPARRHEIAAIARSLAGMRNGGDAGRLRQDAGMNGGDMRVGPGSIIHTEEKSVSDMTTEEYKLHLEKKDNSYLEPDMKKRQANNEKARKDMDKVKGQKNPHFESVMIESPVSELKDELLKMEDHTWQSIDKVMRGIANNHDITPKQLHKDFKKANDGMIPDDWIKTQAVEEECGWYPLSEARIHKSGLIYEVSMIWKGQTCRHKFFWPEMRTPRRTQMERASHMFYPGSRLLTFYPTHEEHDDDMMVLVPPLTEHFSFIDKDNWKVLTEEQADVVEHISNEIGEPLDTPVVTDDNVLLVYVSSHDDGQELIVEWDGLVEDDMKGMSQKSGDKRSTESGAGMTAKGVAKYRAKNPGSKLKTAVTGKVKAGSKAAGRRKSFCARSRGWNGERGKAARRRWKC